MRAPSYIHTYTGLRFHLLNPSAREMRIEDIAHALSQICRFSGHTIKHYSVAQHSCLVSDALPKPFKLCGLLHDGTEAYMNDTITRIKQMMPAYRRLESRMERVMASRFGIPYPFPRAVKRMDRVLLATELRDLFKDADHRYLRCEPLRVRIQPWTPKRAEREFMRRFRVLGGR
jgi:5'-deoxynucleotidase YfbR-like HD superfamily hydrolase